MQFLINILIFFFLKQDTALFVVNAVLAFLFLLEVVASIWLVQICVEFTEFASDVRRLLRGLFGCCTQEVTVTKEGVCRDLNYCMFYVITGNAQRSIG